MTPDAGGRSLAAARGLRIAGGLVTHGLLAATWGAEGYGLHALAVGLLGLLRLWELHSGGAVTALVPLLQAEGNGRGVRQTAWLAWAINGSTAAITSLALWLGAATLAGWYGQPALGNALLALIGWNLLPLLRGPVDGDLLVALRAWRPLLLVRAAEQGAAVLAASWVWFGRATPSGYFLVLGLASVPAAVLSWGLLPAVGALAGAGAGPRPGRRFLRLCLPLTGSQVLFRLYAHAGAPLLAGCLSVAAAGSYRLALTVADLATECAASVPQAFQAELARARRAGAHALRAAYDALLGSAQAVAACTCVALILLPAAAAVAGRFQLTALLVAVLSVQVLFRLWASPASQLFLALEQPGRITRANAAKLALEVLLALALVRWLGAVGLALAHVLAVLPSTLWLLRAAREELLSRTTGTAATPGQLAAVTMVTNSRAVGGLERHVLDLVRALTGRGIECHLLCPEVPAIDAWVADVRAAGARSVQRAGVAAPWDLLGMVRTLRALLGASGLLHFHLNSLDDQAPGMLLATLAGRRARMLATLQLGRGDAPRALSPKGLRRRVALPLPQYLLAVSDALRREVLPRWRRDAARVVTSHNGIELTGFAADPALRAAFRKEHRLAQGELALLFVGRLVPQKGVTFLLDALAELRGTPVRLFVAGDGPLAPELRARAPSIGIDAVFLGSRSDVRTLMCGADVLVLPSLHEGLPLVLIEAMAAGLLVVATRVGGNPEIVVDGENGFLVPPADSRALAWRLGQVVKMPMAERRRMGAAGLAHVRRQFTLQRQVDDVLRVYAELQGVSLPPSPAVTPAPTKVPDHAGAAR